MRCQLVFDVFAKLLSFARKDSQGFVGHVREHCIAAESQQQCLGQYVPGWIPSKPWPVSALWKWENDRIDSSFINYRYYGLLWVIPCHFRIRHGESPWMDDHWCHRRENKPWPSTRAALDDGSKLGAPLGHWTDKPLATGLSKTPLKWLVFGNPILVSGSGDNKKFYGFCQTW